MAPSASTSNVVVQVSSALGTMGADLKLPEFKPGRIEWLDPLSLSTTTLVTGNQDIGRVFTGVPAIGGRDNEPINDRYIVFFSVSDAAHGKGALIKYDRLKQTTSHISLGGPEGEGVQPQGQPLMNGKDLWVGFNAPLGIVPTSGAAARFVTPKPLFENFYHAIQTPMNFEVTKSGQIWAIGASGTGGSDCEKLTLNRYLPDTGETDLANSVFFEPPCGSAMPAEVKQSTLTSLNDILVFVQSGAASLTGLACYDPATRDVRAIHAYEQSGVGYVRGPTATSRDELYVATTTSKIWKVDVGNCTSTPSVSEVAAFAGRSATTRLFEASDGKLYFGTSDGTLMRFDPSTRAVEVVRSFAAATGSSDIVGYLSETKGRKLLMVLRDVDATGWPVARRLVSFDPATNIFIQKDVSKLIVHDARYPGATPAQW